MDPPGQLAEFESDFEFLLKMKKTLMREMEKHGENPGDLEEKDKAYKRGYYTTAPDNKKVRVVLPHGLPRTADHPFRVPPKKNDSSTETSEEPRSKLFWVGFIGNKVPDDSLPQSVSDRAWSLDYELIAELANHKNMLAYVTGERGPKGDWGNLVLFSDLAAVSEWSGCPIHTMVVNEISPHYYTNVRVHGGELPRGIHSTKFLVERTIFLDYRNGAKRHFQLWQNTGELESPFMDVVPAKA